MTTEISLSRHQLAMDQASGPQPVVAFFDMDRTLILGFSALALAREYLRRGSPGVRHGARELLAHIEQRSGGQNFHRLFKSLAHTLEGVPEDELTAIGEAAFERHMAGSIYREARKLIQHHQQLGHQVAIISAATRYQVEPVARSLGITEIYCTRLEISKGCLTGNVIQPLCYGEGKVFAATRSARQHGADLAHCWFYSDSKDDLPLLQAVGHPVPTNPSAALASFATAAGWPVLRFCSRGKPNLESVLRTGLLANTLLTTAAAGAASWLLSRSPVKASNRMASWLGDVGSAMAGLEFEVSGMQFLEQVRPAIFVFNHQSYLDSVVMAWLVRHDFVPLCKQELAEQPLLGRLMKAQGAIFVDRDATNQTNCLQQAMAVLRAGKSLLIAPEGTRSASGELGEFKHGAVYLAKKTGVPLVPVVLHNVADAMPKGSLLLRPATIQVSVLAPLMPLQMGGVRQTCQELADAYQRCLDNGWNHSAASSAQQSSATDRLNAA